MTVHRVYERLQFVARMTCELSFFVVMIMAVVGKSNVESLLVQEFQCE